MNICVCLCAGVRLCVYILRHVVSSGNNVSQYSVPLNDKKCVCVSDPAAGQRRSQPPDEEGV